MRRFFRTQRGEDHSQIQYLTAKCARLAQEKTMLDKLNVISLERERNLQVHLEALTSRILECEQCNRELRTKHEQLICSFREQQDLVDFLQQHVSMLAQGSWWDVGLLQQIGAELLSLQVSEAQLRGLAEELRAEARRGAAVTESLRAQLRRKTAELEQLQDTNKSLEDELSELQHKFQRKMSGLQQENQRSLGKLKDTVEQFEWLCEQQRSWMSSVKRCKVRLIEEKETLEQQVSTLERKVRSLKQSSPDEHSGPTSLQDTECCDVGSVPSHDHVVMSELTSTLDTSRTVCEAPL